MNRGELYGIVSETTKEWHDGLVGTIVRNCVKDSESDYHKWVVFDGPVDAL